MLQRPPPLPMDQPLTQWPRQLLQQLLMHLHTIVRSLARRETGVRASQVLLSDGCRPHIRLHNICMQHVAWQRIFCLYWMVLWCLTQNCRLWSRVAQRSVAVVFLWECKILSGMASWNLQMLEVVCQAVNHLHHTISLQVHVHMQELSSPTRSRRRGGRKSATERFPEARSSQMLMVQRLICVMGGQLWRMNPAHTLRARFQLSPLSHHLSQLQTWLLTPHSQLVVQLIEGQRQMTCSVAEKSQRRRSKRVTVKL